MCCCTTSEPNAFAFDMVNPQGTCQEVVKELQLPIALGVTDEEPPSQEMDVLIAARQWSRRHNTSTLPPKLLQAVKKDDGPAVLQYVADGTDFEEMGEALRLASHRGSAAVVRELVAVGLTVNKLCPHTGFAPVHLAASCGHLLVCELLLDALADVQQRVGGQENAPTAMSIARKMGNLEIEEVMEQHLARQLLEQQGELGDLLESTRLHVLPRVSHGLSTVVMRHVTPPYHSQVGDVQQGFELADAYQGPSLPSRSVPERPDDPRGDMDEGDTGGSGGLMPDFDAQPVAPDGSGQMQHEDLPPGSGGEDGHRADKSPNGSSSGHGFGGMNGLMGIGGAGLGRKAAGTQQKYINSRDAGEADAAPGCTSNGAVVGTPVTPQHGLQVTL